jgi:Cu/Ag efflux protein CusF
MRLQFFTTVTILALLAGCAAPQKPAGKVEDVVEARATVTAIDPPQRLIALKDEKGDEMVVEVPEAVKNLDQVKVGDEVVVSYTEAVAWQVKPASQGAPGVSTDAGVTTAKPGEKPGGTAGQSVTVTTTITGIDLAAGTVTLTGPGGQSRTIKARDPANLKKVQVGDLVDITYSEAVAVAVRPASNK